MYHNRLIMLAIIAAATCRCGGDNGSFDGQLSSENTQVVVSLFVEGIPDGFTSAPASLANYWPAPTCARYGASIPAYTMHYGSVILDESMNALGWETRERFVGVPKYGSTGRMLQIHLADDSAGTLMHQLLPGFYETAGTDTNSLLDSETAATGAYHVDVVSTAEFSGPGFTCPGFTIPGLIYIGRETDWVTDADENTFGSTPENPATFLRGVYVWRWGATAKDQWLNSYSHIDRDTGAYKRATVTDHPTDWWDRRAVVLIDYLHSDGTPVDSGWRGANEWEYYSGFAFEPSELRAYVPDVLVVQIDDRLSVPMGGR